MKRNKALLFPAALLLCLLGALGSLCFGAVPLSPVQLWQAIQDGATSTAGYILWYSRLPRTAACLLAGGALAVSGCILQRVLGNNLASPSIIGVNSGAGLAVTICCATGTLSGWAFSLSAFSGALAAVLFVTLLSRATGASRTTVILTGVAINSILGAMSDAVITLIPDAAMLSGDFRVGGFSSVVPGRVMSAGCLIVLAFLVSLTLCNELDVLSLGEETAQSLGLSVRKIRTCFLLLAALLAGCAVSFAGLLGFIGLLVPHVASRLAGSQSRDLLPLSALLGAGFVTVCDLAARLLFAPYELPVGILLSLIGGPCFLILLLNKKGGHRNA